MPPMLAEQRRRRERRTTADRIEYMRKSECATQTWHGAGERKRTWLAGVGVVAPNIDAATWHGDADAVRRLDTIVRRRFLTDGIVRVKIRDAQRRLGYSDDPRPVSAPGAGTTARGRLSR